MSSTPASSTLVDIFFGRPLSPRLVGALGTAALIGPRLLAGLWACGVVFGPLLLNMTPVAN